MEIEDNVNFNEGFVLKLILFSKCKNENQTTISSSYFLTF